MAYNDFPFSIFFFKIYQLKLLRLMWKKNSRCSHEQADGLWQRHVLKASFGSVSEKEVMKDLAGHPKG